MIRTTFSISALTLIAVLAGCGGGATPPPETPAHKSTGPTTAAGAAVDPGAQSKFEAALEVFAAHDKANDWSDAVCGDVASKFTAAAAEQKGGKFPEAIFDAGLAF